MPEYTFQRNAKKIYEAFKSPEDKQFPSLAFSSEILKQMATTYGKKELLKYITEAYTTSYHSKGLSIEEKDIENTIKDCSIQRKINYYHLLEVSNLYLAEKESSTDTNHFPDVANAELKDFESAWNQQNYGLALTYWVNLSLDERSRFLINLTASSPEEFEKHSHVISIIIPLLTSMPDLKLDNCVNENGKGLLELSSDKPALFNALIDLDYINANINIDNEPLLIWMFKHLNQIQGRSLLPENIDHIFLRHPELLDQIKNKLTAEHWQTKEGEDGRGMYTFAGFIVLNLRRDIFRHLKLNEAKGINLSTKTTSVDAGYLTITDLIHFHNGSDLITRCIGENLASDKRFSQQACYQSGGEKYRAYSVEYFVMKICDLLKLTRDDPKIKKIREEYLNQKDSYGNYFSNFFHQLRITHTIEFMNEYQDRVFSQLKVLLKDYSDEDLKSLEIGANSHSGDQTHLNNAIIETCIALLYPTADVLKIAHGSINGRMTIARLHDESPEVFGLLCKHPGFRFYRILNEKEKDTLISHLIKSGEISTLRKIPGYNLNRECVEGYTPLLYAVHFSNSRVLKELSQDKIIGHLRGNNFSNIKLSQFLDENVVFTNPENMNVVYNGVHLPFFNLLKLLKTAQRLTESMTTIFHVTPFNNVVYFNRSWFHEIFFIKAEDVSSADQNSFVLRILEAAEEALHQEFRERPVSGSYCSGFYSYSANPKAIDNKTYGWPLIDALRALRDKIDQAEDKGKACQHNFLREAISIIDSHIGPGMLFTRSIPPAGNNAPYRARFARNLEKLMLQQNCVLNFNFPKDVATNYEPYVTEVREKFKFFADIRYRCSENAIDHSAETGYSWLPGWSST